ncbi:MAG: 2-C-methyl-D-erythritol 4-phosphate cytidylyltransferase [Gammaproteobacteria bacterium]|nr:2-C-methyl-D-erythritol 4-phosphate cytidylyltransferase [Gammaproteobacteria bacterium]
MRHWVLVPAAGSGSRMHSDKPKQYLNLNGLPVLSHSLLRLQQGVQPAAIVVVLRPDDPDWPHIKKPDCEIIITEGGPARCDSVLNGLRALQNQAADDDWIWVHDAARPCVRVEDLKQLNKTIYQHAVGGLLALPITDTVKQSNEQRQSIATVDRSRLWRALTPQVFHYRLLLDALIAASQAGQQVTDEAQAIELSGLKPLLVEGQPDNIKITRQEDMAIAELYLNRQAAQKGVL